MIGVQSKHDTDTICSACNFQWNRNHAEHTSATPGFYLLICPKFKKNVCGDAYHAFTMSPVPVISGG